MYIFDLGWTRRWEYSPFLVALWQRQCRHESMAVMPGVTFTLWQQGCLWYFFRKTPWNFSIKVWFFFQLSITFMKILCIISHDITMKCGIRCTKGLYYNRKLIFVFIASNTIKHFIWLLRNDRYEINCLMTFNLIMYIKDSWSTAQIIWQYTKHWSCHGCHGFLLLMPPVVVLTTTCGTAGGGAVGIVTALVGLQNVLSGNGFCFGIADIHKGLIKTRVWYMTSTDRLQWTRWQ